MRIECTQGCGAILDVTTPKFSDVTINAPGSVTIDEATAQLEAIRADADRAIGHAITEAMLAHMLFDCPVAQAADANCGHTSPLGHECNLQTKHDGAHQHQVDETDATHWPPVTTTRTIATWPNLQAVPSE